MWNHMGKEKRREHLRIDAKHVAEELRVGRLCDFAS